MRSALQSARTVLLAQVPDEVLHILDSPRAWHPSAGAIAPSVTTVETLAVGRRVHRPSAGGSGHSRREQPKVSRESALLQLLRPYEETPPTTSSVDWNEILSLAARERVTSLVFAAVGLDNEDVPYPVRRNLAQSFQTAAEGAREGYGQLANVLRRLKSAGLKPLLLKGAALARFTYEDPALRPFSDVDVLVRLNEIEAIHRVLLTSGYALAGDEPSPADRTWRQGRGYYDPDGRRLVIDVHWRYSGYPLLMQMDYPGVFQRALEVLIEGEPVLLPSPADMLVALSIFFLRELWYGKPKLRYLRDLLEVIRQHRIDWGVVLGTAQESSLVWSSLYFALGTGAALFGTPVPPAVWRELTPKRGQAVGHALLARISDNVMRPEHPVRTLLQFAVMPWLGGDPFLRHLEWISQWIRVPGALAPSRRRWIGRMWRGSLGRVDASPRG